MLRHYLKTAIRGIKFHPFYSSISILGLSIGLASCLLIYSYWSFEKSFDQFHANSSDIFRITQSRTIENGELAENASTFSKVGQEIKSQIPQAKSLVRIHKTGQNTSIQAGDKILVQEGILGAEPGFFDVFSFEFEEGSKELWLSTPQAVVLTSGVAKRFFGTKNPIGQQITINGAYGAYRENGYQEFKNYTVAGVIEDIPSNTHLDFTALISLNLFADPDREFSNWGDQFYTYVKLQSSADQKILTEGLKKIETKIFPDQGISLKAQELESIHLSSNLINEFKTNGSQIVLNLLAGLAFLVLLIAGCNYVNFATARAIQRHKEIGLRKIFWAGKMQIFSQLLIEALLINLVAFTIALLFIVLINPILINVTGINLLQQLVEQGSWMVHLGIIGLTVLFSGLYPAWLVSKSSYQTLSVKSQSQIRIQRPLVVFQFTISIFVIGFTLVIARQVNFMKISDPGLSLEKTLVISGPTVESKDINRSQQLSVLKEALSSNPKVTGISSANFIPGKMIPGKASGYVRRLNTPEEGAKTYSFTQIDGNFITEFGIKTVAGEAFPLRAGKDRILINEEASRLLGFEKPEEAIGQRIHYRSNSTPEILAVVQNFHQFSLQQQYQPIIFEVREQPDSYLYLKYHENSEAQLLPEIAENWQRSFPGNPFNYFYLDDYYNLQYQKDENFYQVFQLFSGLGILVASLGFFGLTYFLATSKIKEIGIRKTLGAGFLDILKILGKGSLPSILIAGALSMPLIYWLGNDWLENYAFRIQIRWWMLAIPILLFTILALTLILVQGIRTFVINPVISLQEGSNGTLER